MSTYLIVGASSGIGRQLAGQLAEAGHRVYGTYHEHEMPGDREQLSYHPCNVLDESLPLDFLPDRLDGLVYCPGAIQLRPFHRIRPEDFVRDFELQVVGAVKVLQAALPKLKAAEWASVVLFSTVAVRLGFHFHAQVAASKGAVEGLTRSLAAEWAPRIRVNCIAPSLTDTPLAATLLNTEEKKEANAQRHPLKRVGVPADIAAMAEFLLSDRAGWVSGQVIHVDGGMSGIKM